MEQPLSICFLSLAQNAAKFDIRHVKVKVKGIAPGVKVRHKDGDFVLLLLTCLSGASQLSRVFSKEAFRLSHCKMSPLFHTMAADQGKEDDYDIVYD